MGKKSANNGRVMAIIPARSGSKRLKNKNVRDFKGKPLIEWTIQAACQSMMFAQVIVTSDSEEILAIAKRNGCVSHLRSTKLASDTASTVDVVTDVITSHKGFDKFVLLQPTSPLRTKEDIIEVCEIASTRQEVTSVVSVTVQEHSPLWSCQINEKGEMEFISDGIALTKRSQDLPSYYRLNGAIYLQDIEVFEQQRSFINKDTVAYVMPSERSVDIDTEYDFSLAGLLYETSGVTS